MVAIPKDARQHARQRRALRPRITAPERIRYDTPDSRGLHRRTAPDRLRRVAETRRRAGGHKPRGIGADRRHGEPTVRLPRRRDRVVLDCEPEAVLGRGKSCKRLILKKLNNIFLQ